VESLSSGVGIGFQAYGELLDEYSQSVSEIRKSLFFESIQLFPKNNKIKIKNNKKVYKLIFFIIFLTSIGIKKDL
jgi:hypothetical protein